MECNCHKQQGKNCIEIVPIFSNLTYEEMMEIARITIDKTFEKGEMIYTAGSKGKNLYVIHKGKVKITRISHSGKEQVIRILGSGEFMGELSLFSSSSLTDNAEALEKTTVCKIDGEKFPGLIEKYPTIFLKILEELSKRLEKAENLIENLSLHGVSKRLSQYLISMSDEKGIVILKMSKKDLASYIGVSQETLSRKLSSFQEMGLIKLVGHRKVVILDKDSLDKVE